MSSWDSGRSWSPRIGTRTRWSTIGRSIAPSCSLVFVRCTRRCPPRQLRTRHLQVRSRSVPPNRKPAGNGGFSRKHEISWSSSEPLGGKIVERSSTGRSPAGHGAGANPGRCRTSSGLGGPLTDSNGRPLLTIERQNGNRGRGREAAGSKAAQEALTSACPGGGAAVVERSVERHIDSDHKSSCQC